MNTKKVTRLEVIGKESRILVLYDIEIEDVVLQDEGKTLKIFLNENKNVEELLHP